MLTRSPPPLVLSAGANTVTASGSIVFSNSNGIGFGFNGSTLTASHNGLTTARASTDGIGLNTAQTNVTWTVNSSGLSLNAGGYAGTGFTSTTTAGTQIKATQNTAGLSMAVPAYLTAAAGGGFSAGVSTGGNTNGDTGVTGTRLVFVGNPNITLSQATDANGATITFSGGAGAAGNTGFISAGGATASLGTVVFSNSNNISFGVNGQTVTGSVAGSATSVNAVASASSIGTATRYALEDHRHEGVFTLGVSTGGNTAGNTRVGPGQFVLQASNSLTLSQQTAANGLNTLHFQVGAYITTARASTDAIGLNTAQTNVTWTVNSSGISLNAGGYAGTGFTSTTTAGTAIVGTHNTAGLSVGVPAFLTTADLSANSSNYVRNWKLTGNTAGTTSSAQGTDFWLAGGNGITVSGSSNTISFSVGNYLTTARGSTDAIGLNTAQTNVTWTVNSSGLSLNAGGYAGTGFTSTTTAGTEIKATQNTAGLSMAIPAYLTTAAAAGISVGVSTGGNTAGDTGLFTGRVVFAGGANITLSGSSNGGSVTYTISGATVAGQPVNFSAGTTSSDLGSVVFSNSNLVSFGLNGSTITGSVPGTSSLSATGPFSISVNGATISMGVAGVNVYAASNTFGTSSGTADLRTLSIAGAGGVSVAASNSGWVISAPLNATVSEYDPYQQCGALASMVTNSTIGQNSIYFQPFDLPQDLYAYRLNLFASVAQGHSNANSTGRAGYTISAALYSRGTGTNTNRIETFWSGTAGMSLTQNSNTQIEATNLAGISNSTQVSTVATAISSSNASTYALNSMGGFRVIPLPISSNLTPGRYWLAVANSTTSSNAGVVTLNCSVMQVTSVSNYIAFRPFGTVSAASNVSWPALRPGLGTYSATSGAFPATVPLTTDHIRAAVVSVPAIVFNLSGYTTNASAL